MMITVLFCFLIASFSGARGICDENCSNSMLRSLGQGRTSYSSHYQSSSFSNNMNHPMSNSNSPANFEGLSKRDLDTDSSDRPRNWNDEKHFITDDGKGRMSYKEGQIVTDGSITRYASHNYRYSSHDSETPPPNAQVLSQSEFDNQVQRIRNSISNFNQNFRFNSALIVNENTNRNFKSQAELIRNQVNDVCNQIDPNSSMYMQMQDMLRQFNENVSRKESMMQQFISRNINNNNNNYYGENYPQSTSRDYYPHTTSSNYYPVHDRPTHRVMEGVKSLQTSVSSFYKQFNRLSIDSKYLQDLDDRSNAIKNQISSLQAESSHDSHITSRLESLKTQFETYVSQLKERLEEMVNERNQEQSSPASNYTRQMNYDLYRNNNYQQPTAPPRRHQNYNREEIRNRQSSSFNRQSQTNVEQESSYRSRVPNYNRQPDQAQEQSTATRSNYRETPSNTQAPSQQSTNLDRDQDQSFTYERNSEVHRSIPFSISSQTESEYHVRQSLSEENRASSRQRNQDGQLQLVNGQVDTSHYWPPTVVAITEATPSNLQTSSFGSASTPSAGESTTYLDMIALNSRLRQDLRRAEHEMNTFVNKYSIRLTASNTETLGKELEMMAERIRSNIKSLCQQTETYKFQSLNERAEELNHRFEDRFKDFLKVIDQYHQERSEDAGIGFISSSGGTSSHFHNTELRKPQVTRVELEKERTIEIEASRRMPHISASIRSPGLGENQQVQIPLQTRSSSGNFLRTYSESHSQQQRSSGSSSSSRDEDCVEIFAGQPCISKSSLVNV